MQLKTLVKISGVGHLHDARYGAGMGVQLLGIPLDPDHKQHLSPASFSEIRNWVVGPRWVGELSNSPRVALSEYELDYLQTSSVDALPELQAYNLPLILRIPSTNPDDWEKVMAAHRAQVSYFLIEPKAPIPLEAPTLATLEGLARTYPIVLGFGLTAALLPKILEADFAGIALQSEAEEKVGYKDFDGLADILELLEEE